jgi:group I intron endonuclease
VEDERSFGIIYKATFPNGKCYVGQTVGTLKRRTAEHLRHAKDDLIFHKAIIKYGAESVVWEEIDYADNIESLNEKEIFYIDFYNSFAGNKKGYNGTRGGDGKLACVHSETSKKKMSDAHKGKPLSAEHRAKIGAAGKGRVASDETRAKMMGRKPSEATRAKLSAAQMGNTKNLGHKASAETRAKLRAAQSGENNPMSTKNRAKRALALESSQCQTM